MVPSPLYSGERVRCSQYRKASANNNDFFLHRLRERPVGHGGDGGFQDRGL